MFKRLFQSDSSENRPRPEGVRGNGASPSATAAKPVEHSERISAASVANPASPASSVAPPATPDSFDHVYENAAVKPPSLSYGILKVAEMASSPRLAGMALDLKRSSIMMALDAAGAQIDRLLEDAVFRQRALNDRDEALQKSLREFEAAKSDEVAKIQTDLDAVTAQHMARVQAILDEVARQQDVLRGWQKRKHQECQRIADAAMYCVPNGQPVNETYSNLLERGASSSRRAEVAK